ncbi:ArsS family sensor histidine kinase [Poseidonibacter ostreae]|jgi:two-component system, OmpR family, sensor kinase|uniref:histidine kinase n=1 Tax=Poseidonibacter ostreae TaxID=2654171 RepID=A0ABQ6VQL8_9BACT|nr:ArsS family sensor histidine kinase [Poseidonibacter ostreae]KAB7884513.1 HAMP domain-containing protein [Poseidonibacter ostreae]KAB7892907.1 HAMP domain-containing protein [Poseidonibacter ostreae]MAC82757.1 histidine kinase [Arcobacter sp.]
MSLFKKITILFIISFILMTIIGLWIDIINNNRLNNLIKDKYKKVANELFINIYNNEDIKIIEKKYGLKKISSEKSINILHKENLTFGYIIIGKQSFSDEFIIKIKYLDEELTYETQDEDDIRDKNILNVLIFLDIFVLILIFLYIFKLLAPLKKINLKMKDFSQGKLETRINIESNDEIGELASSFDSMASNLENLIKTREVLLRDIGHELRTPIAKGKFAIEKIENNSQKEVFKKIFSDLEILTNDLIELEKLNTQSLEIKKFSVDTLVLSSLQKLYIEDESLVQLQINDNFTINADLYYLSIAVKNLIDNALKYTKKYPIIIKAENNTLSIINNADRLNKDINHYLKPFTQENSKKEGFGLGLSIVNKILQKHKLNLEYDYLDSNNIFSIKYN